MSASLQTPIAELVAAYLDELDLEGVDLLHAKLATLAAEMLDDPETPAHARPRVMASLRQSIRDVSASPKATKKGSAADARALLAAVSP